MSYKRNPVMNSADTGTAPGDFTTKHTTGTQWGASHLARTRYRVDEAGVSHMLLPPHKEAQRLAVEAQKVKE